jgi:hypothetical protein
MNRTNEKNVDVVKILKIIVCLVTAATGLLCLVKPSLAYGFIGLTASSVRGVSEMRAIFGGLFIALGLAPLFLGNTAYRMLGIGYLAIALARTFSTFFDQSFAKSNWISLAIEVVFGFILLL